MKNIKELIELYSRKLKKSGTQKEYYEKTKQHNLEQYWVDCEQHLEMFIQALNQLLNQTEWISVKDRLPIKDGKYLILRERPLKTRKRHPWISPYPKVEWWRWGGFSIDNVTHWLPIPNPPNCKHRLNWTTGAE